MNVLQAQGWFDALGGLTGIQTLVIAVASLITAIAALVKAFKSDRKAGKAEAATLRMENTIQARLAQTQATHIHLHQQPQTTGAAQTPATDVLDLGDEPTP